MTFIFGDNSLFTPEAVEDANRQAARMREVFDGNTRNVGTPDSDTRFSRHFDMGKWVEVSDLPAPEFSAEALERLAETLHNAQN